MCALPKLHLWDGKSLKSSKYMLRWNVIPNSSPLLNFYLQPCFGRWFNVRKGNLYMKKILNRLFKTQKQVVLKRSTKISLGNSELKRIWYKYTALRKISAFESERKIFFAPNRPKMFLFEFFEFSANYSNVPPGHASGMLKLGKDKKAVHLRRRNSTLEE